MRSWEDVTDWDKKRMRLEAERSRVVLDRLILDDTEISTWRCQIGSWIYGYRAERRGVDWRNKILFISILMVSEIEWLKTS